MSITNCMDCGNHQVIPDPDPDDWFCDDDVAVVCKITPNDKKDPTSRWTSDYSAYKPVAWSCRPYNTRKESEVPSWCPLKQGNQNEKQ